VSPGTHPQLEVGARLVRSAPGQVAILAGQLHHADATGPGRSSLHLLQPIHHWPLPPVLPCFHQPQACASARLQAIHRFFTKMALTRLIARGLFECLYSGGGSLW